MRITCLPEKILPTGCCSFWSLAGRSKRKLSNRWQGSSRSQSSGRVGRICRVREGCRNCADHGFLDCAISHHVIRCYECEEFPCDKLPVWRVFHWSACLFSLCPTFSVKNVSLFSDPVFCHQIWQDDAGAKRTFYFEDGFRPMYLLQRHGNGIIRLSL